MLFVNCLRQKNNKRRHRYRNETTPIKEDTIKALNTLEYNCEDPDDKKYGKWRTILGDERVEAATLITTTNTGKVKSTQTEAEEARVSEINAVDRAIQVLLQTKSVRPNTYSVGQTVHYTPFSKGKRKQYSYKAVIKRAFSSSYDIDYYESDQSPDSKPTRVANVPVEQLSGFYGNKQVLYYIYRQDSNYKKLVHAVIEDGPIMKGPTELMYTIDFYENDDADEAKRTTVDISQLLPLFKKGDVVSYESKTNSVSKWVNATIVKVDDRDDRGIPTGYVVRYAHMEPSTILRKLRPLELEFEEDSPEAEEGDLEVVD